MRRFSISAAIALIALVVVLGCQSSTAPAPQAMAAPQRAVVVSGGNGPAFTVFIPTNDPAQPEMLCSSAAATECPECKAAAVKYFTTGVLDTKCSITGALRTDVTGTPYVSHN